MDKRKQTHGKVRFVQFSKHFLCGLYGKREEKGIFVSLLKLYEWKGIKRSAFLRLCWSFVKSVKEESESKTDTKDEKN